MIINEKRTLTDFICVFLTFYRIVFFWTTVISLIILRKLNKFEVFFFSSWLTAVMHILKYWIAFSTWLLHRLKKNENRRNIRTRCYGINVGLSYWISAIPSQSCSAIKIKFRKRLHCIPIKDLSRQVIRYFSKTMTFWSPSIRRNSLHFIWINPGTWTIQTSVN